MDLNLITNLGYEVETIDDGIYLVKNFITEEEQKTILNYIEAASEDIWNSSYLNDLRFEAMRKYGRDDIENIPEIVINPYWIGKSMDIPDETLALELTNRMRPMFNENYSVRLFTKIQRQLPGVSLHEHYDQGHDTKLKFASVTYLNEDYLDGELYFPDRGLTLRLPARSLIIFNSGAEYVHGVKPVGDGPTRYVITSFIWDKE